MAITQDILTVYAALAEHIYRRDSTLDQALSLLDIAKVLGLNPGQACIIVLFSRTIL